MRGRATVRHIAPAALRAPILIAVWLTAGCCAPLPHEALRGELTRVLDAQADAWNRADLHAFMQTYWRSEELSFSAGGKTTRGWNTTLERYQSRYPDPAAMGVLTFDVDEVRALGPAAALLLGRYHLTRAARDGSGPASSPAQGAPRAAEVLSGNFTLIFRRVDGQWRIVHDHTSALPAAE